MHILIAIIIFILVAAFRPVYQQDYNLALQTIPYAIIIILVAVFSKRIIAYALDAGIEHELWYAQRFGFRPHFKLKKPIPAAIIFPIFFSIITLGVFKLLTFLTYETKALKHRAAKRFGFYSFKEMTDWHIAWIGAISNIALIILAIISYIIGLEYMAKLTIYYAVLNLLPLYKFDGMQILMGNKILYTILLIINLIFAASALII